MRLTGFDMVQLKCCQQSAALTAGLTYESQMQVVLPCKANCVFMVMQRMAAACVCLILPIGTA